MSDKMKAILVPEDEYDGALAALLELGVDVNGSKARIARVMPALNGSAKTINEIADEIGCDESTARDALRMAIAGNQVEKVAILRDDRALIAYKKYAPKKPAAATIGYTGRKPTAYYAPLYELPIGSQHFLSLATERANKVMSNIRRIANVTGALLDIKYPTDGRNGLIVKHIQ